MDEQRIKRDVLSLFEYAHDRPDWVNPLREALDAVTAEDAAVNPSLNTRSIWQIVLHMTVWSKNVERWYPGYHHDLPEGSTPPIPATRDEAAWDAARQRLIDTIEQLRAEIQAKPPSELLEPAPEGTTLFEEYLGRMIHNAYHLGQITMLRECLPRLGDS